MPDPRSSFPPSEPALAPGDVLARKYRLEEPLGEGNMAVVWVALNMALETRVAVKILRAGLAGDPRLVARFRQEAKATAAIAHKNIVQVYDYGVTSWGAPFMVMELLQGETLAQRLKARGALPPDEAVLTVMRAMKGVTVAHAKGVIHRDLKPDNIFLAREENGSERPKVLDFGVSFVARASGDDRLTKAGGIVGTPSYLPPEAIEGDNRGDARGDVWALGVLLYETISGRLPFQGKSVHALLEAICKNTPQPLAGAVDGVDDALQAIIDRAMAKDPDERYSSVRELYDDLSEWLTLRGGAMLSAAYPSASSLARSSQLPSLFDLDDDGPTLIGEAAPHRPSERSPSSSREMITRGDRASASPEPPRASALDRPPPAPLPSASSRLAWIAGALSLVAFALLAALRSPATHREAGPEHVPASSASSPAPAPPASSACSSPSGCSSASPAPPAASSAEPSDEATLDVLGLPDHALVRLDGRRVDHLPVAVTRGRTVQLRVDAPGHEPWLQEVVIEGSLKLRYSPRAAPLPRASPAAGNYREVPY